MMSTGNQGWKWWQKLAVAALLVFVTLGAVFVGFRKPWIQPIPGVRTELTRPFVRESELGPDSAYMLLLDATRKPADTDSTPDGRRVWRGDWQDAVEKLATHPMPTTPPPPAPQPSRENAARGQEQPQEDPFFAPPTFGNALDEPAAREDDGESLRDLPRDHPALRPEAPWTREQWEDVQRLMKLYEPNIAILDRAIAAPDPQVPTADNPSFLLPYLTHVREFSRWLSVSAQYRASVGDYEGAVRDLERTLDMADIISRGGTMINHLVTCACDAIAASAAWNIATRHDLPPAALERLTQTFLHHLDSAEPFVEAMRSESMMGDAIVSLVYGGEGIVENLGALGSGGSGGGPSSPVSHLVNPLVRMAGSSPAATRRNLTACYQHMVAIADKPYSKSVQDEYDAFDRDLYSLREHPHRIVTSMRDPVGYLLASMLLPALSRAHSKEASRNATFGAMATFCALQRYQKETGALPESLDQLVPRYLPSVPIDPFDGNTIHYLRKDVPNLPEDAWAVYSIGTDFIDDGGDARSVGSPRAKRFQNPDLVWPSQEYPEERVLGHTDLFGSGEPGSLFGEE
jgi:hypothetical protein